MTKDITDNISLGSVETACVNANSVATNAGVTSGDDTKAVDCIKTEGYTLYRGDCLEVMDLVAPASCTLALIDPPYGCLCTDWDKKLKHEKLWELLHKVTQLDSAMVLFSQFPYSAELVMSNKKEFRYNWVWQRNNIGGFLTSHHRPMRNCEEILVFSRLGATYNKGGSMRYYPQGVKKLDKPCYAHFRKSVIARTGMIKKRVCYNMPTQILYYPKDSELLHPTQKPVALLEYLIKTYTCKGETVIDCCMGSGSTGVAAINTRRKFIGIELLDKYFSVAAKRLERAVIDKKQSFDFEEDEVFDFQVKPNHTV